MRAMPRVSRRPRNPAAGAPAGPESRHPPDSAGTRGIARMARSYEEAAAQGRGIPQSGESLDWQDGMPPLPHRARLQFAAG